MSCPFFEPLAPRSRMCDPALALYPLGDCWDGLCRVSEELPPAPATTLCNFGYARGECPRFPLDAPFDAVRFALSGPPGGGGADAGDLLHIRWSAERDHHPHAHGSATYSTADDTVEAGTGGTALLDAQLRAYASSYLRLRSAMAPAPVEE